MQQVSLGELAKRVPVQAPMAAPAPAAQQGGGPRRAQQQQGGQPNYEGMNKNKLEREKKKQNPEHRAKERVSLFVWGKWVAWDGRCTVVVTKALHGCQNNFHEVLMSLVLCAHTCLTLMLLFCVPATFC